MRNIRPILLAVQPSPAELIVQFPHPVSGPLHLAENGRSGGKEGFDVSQFDAEGDDAAASLFQEPERSLFASHELARRQDGEMGGHVRQSRMEFASQFGDKLAYRIPDIRHQSVA